MNILLINHYAGSPLHGMAYRPYYLAREWIKAGHKVLILGASHSHIRSTQPDMEGKPVQDEALNDVVYRWYATPVYNCNGIGRLRNILAFMRALKADSRRLVRDFRPNIVIASSTYPMDIWPAHRIAKLAGAKLVFEVHDLWPLSPMEIGGMSRWHPFIMWVQMAEDYAYRHSDKVVSMLPKTLPHMQSRGLDEKKWSYVPNGIDIDEWENPTKLPGGVAEKIENLRDTGKKLVGYAGTHGAANALDTLLDASKFLPDYVRVVLVGLGPERERLLRRVKNERLSHVVMLPAIPKASIPTFLAKLDIAFIGWREKPLYRFGITPNKLMDYMMAGKPVVHSVKAGNDPVAEAGCGLSVPPGDARAIADAIQEILALPDEDRAALGERGRKFILANQTYSVLADRFIEAVKAS